ncbi:MAG: hypothetical protein R3Y28_06160 [Candidatus Gastranaerophilales bacterium]
MTDPKGPTQKFISKIDQLKPKDLNTSNVDELIGYINEDGFDPNFKDNFEYSLILTIFYREVLRRENSETSKISNYQDKIKLAFLAHPDLDLNKQYIDGLHCLTILDHLLTNQEEPYQPNFKKVGDIKLLLEFSDKIDDGRLIQKARDLIREYNSSHKNNTDCLMRSRAEDDYVDAYVDWLMRQ